VLAVMPEAVCKASQVPEAAETHAVRPAGLGEVARLSVALDATPLLGQRTGVGIFCEHALGALVERHDLEVSAFAVSWRRRQGIRGLVPPGARVIDRPMPARPLHRAWSVGGFPPVEWWTGRCDVVHGTNFVVPPTRGAARVMTVHDLTTVRFPEMCSPQTLAFPALIRRALAEGAWVHTPSRFVAQEVIDMLGADPERVRPISHGVPPTEVLEHADAGLPPGVGPYVLALGTVEPRKDLPGLVRAFDTAADVVSGLTLVIAGPDGWGVDAFDAAVAAARHRSAIVRLGYMASSRRWALLRGATVFAYPSVYEGFGLPPLEAMAVGVPVVTTGAGALPEVVGDAAVTVPPGDPDALAAGLVSMVTDEAARAAMIERGLRRAAGFRWEDTAAGLEALYRDARSAS
jgi:glycosyltransferase involved in cell wall biosynthesis